MQRIHLIFMRIWIGILDPHMKKLIQILNQVMHIFSDLLIFYQNKNF